MQVSEPARYALNVVENAAHEVLLLKRQSSAARGAGLWAFPAGHIEAGESPEAAALRELREEAGQNCRIERIAQLSPLQNSLYGGQDEIHLFHWRWLGGSIKLNAEHSAYAWVSCKAFADYAVMDGVDEDLYCLGIWPRECFNPAKLPPGAP
ncbi:MAG TPA: NUDIX hydrolase [Pseudomonadaceae bacterium]|nr:NUDIX hydrolase [Pseudomonadaceae bacterium]